MRESCIFYKSLFETVWDYEEDTALQMKIINAVAKYAYLDIEPDLSDFEPGLRGFIRVTIKQISASISNYDRGCNGGRPSVRTPELETMVMDAAGNGKTNKEIAEQFNISERTVCTILSEKKQRKNSRKNAKTTYTYTDTSTDTLTSTSTYTDTSTSTYTKNLNKNNNNSVPTQKQIADFCAENSLIVKPEEFYSYYNERGWELVYDWKNLLKKWNKNQLERQKAKDSSDPYAGLR